ncbi:MAG: hypothetical protein QXM31_00720 [Candidatus Woesearchaeota archaeon]
MKKMLVFAAILFMLISVFSVNALVLKSNAKWGFAQVTGRIIMQQNAGFPPCPTAVDIVTKESLILRFDIKVMPDRVDIASPEGNYRLHFKEADSPFSPNIALNEYFVLSSAAGTPFSHVFRFAAIDKANRRLMLTDLATGQREITYSGQNITNMVAGGVTYTVYVYPDAGSLAIDQNGDGNIAGAQTQIVTLDGTAYSEESFVGNPNCNPVAGPFCSDSDNSISYNIGIYSGTALTSSARPDVFTKGSVTYTAPSGASAVFSDSCSSGSYLVENFCQQGKYRGRQGVLCPAGCQDGACIAIAAQAAGCAGIQMVWEQGRRENYTYAADLCTGYRCLRGNEISPACHNAVSCPAACTDGTCVYIPDAKQQCPPCQDSDNGLNYNVRGSVTGALASFPTAPREDACIDGQVREMFCNAQGLGESRLYDCPQGCENGACIGGVTENVTCRFIFTGLQQTCVSSKGSCTGIGACTVPISGSMGEAVSWTGCGKAWSTTIDGKNKDAYFVCGKVRLPSLQPSISIPGSIPIIRTW